jgi:hypothetical protein
LLGALKKTMDGLFQQPAVGLMFCGVRGLVFPGPRRYNARLRVRTAFTEAVMTTVIPITPVATVKITPDNKCSFCRGAICCTYLTQWIETPRSMEDFDMLLWQISHFNTQVYKDEDGWFLLVNNSCTHLQAGGRCGIYDSRPQVCREHSNDECEFDGPCGHDDFELFFPDYEALLAHCRKKFKTWDERFKKMAGPAGKTRIPATAPGIALPPHIPR